MRPRDILAANLRALMATRPDLNTLPKLTARSGVSNGTLDRIRRATVSTRIDELERLARAFSVEPWELVRVHGPNSLSPLGLELAAHLDRAARDEAEHNAAYAAATAAIDALTTTRGLRSASTPDRAAKPAPPRSKEKRGA
jgi:transcriptional regulator with XRE-family HTH domain